MILSNSFIGEDFTVTCLVMYTVTCLVMVVFNPNETREVNENNEGVNKMYE